MMQPVGGPHSAPTGPEQQVNSFPFYGHDPAENIPREGCLLGCTFFIADYPTIVTPSLINAWVRVIREHGGQVKLDPSLQPKPTDNGSNSDVSNRENKSPNEKMDTDSEKRDSIDDSSSKPQSDSSLNPTASKDGASGNAASTMPQIGGAETYEGFNP